MDSILRRLQPSLFKQLGVALQGVHRGHISKSDYPAVTITVKTVVNEFHTLEHIDIPNWSLLGLSDKKKNMFLPVG